MANETTQALEEALSKKREEFNAPSTQMELDRIIESRLNRERAKYSNYEEYKASHEKLMQIEEAERLELYKQKQREEIAQAASRLTQQADELLKGIIPDSSTTQTTSNISKPPEETKGLCQIVVNIVTI